MDATDPPKVACARASAERQPSTTRPHLDLLADADSLANDRESSEPFSPENDGPAASLEHLQELMASRDLGDSINREEILSEVTDLVQQYSVLKRSSSELLHENQILTAKNDELSEELAQLRRSGLVGPPAPASPLQGVLSPQLDGSRGDASYTPKSSHSLVFQGDALQLTPEGVPASVLCGSPGEEELRPFLERIASLHGEVGRLQSLLAESEEESRRLTQLLKERDSQVALCHNVEKSLRNSLHGLSDQNRESYRRSASNLSGVTGGGGGASSSSAAAAASGGPASTPTLTSPSSGQAAGSNASAISGGSSSAMTSPRPWRGAKEVDAMRLEMLEEDNRYLALQNDSLQSQLTALQGAQEAATAQRALREAAPSAAAASPAEGGGSSVYPLTRDEYLDLRRDLDRKESAFQALSQEYSALDESFRRLQEENRVLSLAVPASSEPAGRSAPASEERAQARSPASPPSESLLDGYTHHASEVERLNQLTQYKAIVDDLKRQLQQYAAEEAMLESSVDGVESSIDCCRAMSERVDGVFGGLVVPRTKASFPGAPPTTQAASLASQNATLKELVISLHPELHRLLSLLRSVQSRLNGEEEEGEEGEGEESPASAAPMESLPMESEFAEESHSLIVSEEIEHSHYPPGLIDWFRGISEDWTRLETELSSAPEASGLAVLQRRLGVFLLFATAGLRADSTGFAQGFLAAQEQKLIDDEEARIRHVQTECAKACELCEQDVEDASQETQLYQVDNEYLLQKLKTATDTMEKYISLNRLQREHNDAELAALRKACQSAVSKLTNEKRGLQSEVDALRDSLASLESRCSEERVEWEAQVKTLEASVASLTQECESAQARLANRDAAQSESLLEIEQRLAESDRLLSEKEAALSEASQMLSELQVALQEKEEALVAVQGAHALSESSLERRESESAVVELTAKLSELLVTLQEKESSLQESSTRLSELQSALQEKESALSDSSATLTEGQEVLRLKTALVQELREELGRRESAQTEMEARVQALEAEGERLRGREASSIDRLEAAGVPPGADLSDQLERVLVERSEKEALISELQRSNRESLVQLQTLLEQLERGEPDASQQPGEAAQREEMQQKLEVLETQNAQLIEQLQEAEEERRSRAREEETMPHTPKARSAAAGGEDLALDDEEDSPAARLDRSERRIESLTEENRHLYESVRELEAKLESARQSSPSADGGNSMSDAPSGTEVASSQAAQAMETLWKERCQRDLTNHIIQNHRDQYQRLLVEYNVLKQEYQRVVRMEYNE